MSNSDQDLIDMIQKLNTEQPINHDHRDQLRQRALAAYDERPTSNRKTLRFPTLHFQGATFMKYAASIALLATVGFFATTLMTTELAFAEVARAFLGIKNASFTVSATVYEPGAEPETEEASNCIMELPNRIRVEDPDGSLFIVDLVADKMLTTDPENKMAVVLEGVSDLDDEAELPEDFLTEIQNHLRRAEGSEDFGEIKYEKLGEKKIDGKLAIGYRVTDPEEEDFDYFDIWANVKTALPVQVDFTVTLGKTKVVSSMKNLKFNQQLDANLFSLTPPEGYKLVNGNLDDLLDPKESPLPLTFGDDEFEDGSFFGVANADKSPQLDDLAFTLALYASRVEGQLPAKLDAAEMIESLNKAWKKRNPGKPLFEEDGVKYTDADMVNVVKELSKSMKLVEELDEQDIEYTYAGNGVLAGDKQRPIFWYKPKDSDTFRIIYADLTTIRKSKQAPAKP